MKDIEKTKKLKINKEKNFITLLSNLKFETYKSFKKNKRPIGASM